MGKKILNVVKGVVIFFGSFILMAILASFFIPAGPDGEVVAPTWYFDVCIVVSVTATAFFCAPERPDGKRSRAWAVALAITLVFVFVAEAGPDHSVLTALPILACIVILIVLLHRRGVFKSLKEKLKARAKNTGNNEDLSFYEQERMLEKGADNQAIIIDALTHLAALEILEAGTASVVTVQQQLHIGYGQAARIVDTLEKYGVVGPFEGSRPRKALISKDEYLQRVQIKDDDLAPTPAPTPAPAPVIDFEKIIQDEMRWRREQSHLSPVDFEMQKVDGMEGHAFEYWCADLLRKNGFADVEVTPGSGDHGVDIIAEKDGIRYAVQCKCYSKDIGNKPVQEVNTGKTLYHCQIGIVMTNRHFTAGAKEDAGPNGILLWDREKLKEMLG